MAKKFPLIFDFQANIGPIQSAINNLQTSLGKINLPASFQKSLDSSFLKLNEEIRTFQSLSRGGFNNLSETTKAQSSFNKIISLIDKINISIEDIEGIDPQKLLPQEALKRLEKVQIALKKLKDIETKKSNIEKDIAAETKEYEKQKSVISDLVNKRSLLTSKKKNQTTQLDKINSDLEKTRSELDALTAQMNTFTAEGGKKSDPQYQRMLTEFKALSQQQGASVKSQIKFNKEIQESDVQLAELKTSLSNARKELKITEERLERLNQLAIKPEGLDDLRSTIAQLKGLNIDNIPTDLNEINRILDDFNDEELEQVKKQLVAINDEGKKIPDVVKPAKKELDGLGDTAKELNDVASEMKNLQSNILQFFSISNAIQLFKNAIRDAFETVKELDSVMTEIAVVSDFSVSDMWDKLPEFTEQANELGVSIKDAYAATTLFVQQGLNLNDSMELSSETLKMARIAGMDAADATDAMTAALRGFNMELSETSAQRVNDVYSELAAITAADTEEISTAMTKTASIAHNANMEFETTAAFLSQIINITVTCNSNVA